MIIHMDGQEFLALLGTGCEVDLISEARVERCSIRVYSLAYSLQLRFAAGVQDTRIGGTMGRAPCWSLSGARLRRVFWIYQQCRVVTKPLIHAFKNGSKDHRNCKEVSPQSGSNVIKKRSNWRAHMGMHVTTRRGQRKRGHYITWLSCRQSRRTSLNHVANVMVLPTTFIFSFRERVALWRLA